MFSSFVEAYHPQVREKNKDLVLGLFGISTPKDQLVIDFGTANDDEFIKTIFPEQENQQDNSTYPIFRVSLLEKFKVFF